MDPYFRNYQKNPNHKFQGKDRWILLLEIEKKENTKYFSQTTRLDYPEPSVQSAEQSGLEQ